MAKPISEDKRNMILNGNLFHAILMLAIPVMINSFIQSMYNLTDTFWLGRIGTENQSAITLVSPFQNILINFGNGITTAGAILISQYLGANRSKNPFMPPDAYADFSDRKAIMHGEAVLSAEEAQKVLDELNNSGVRAEIDTRAEKIGYKIREAQLHKIPYMLVIGEKEVESGTVSVRKRGEGDIGAMSIADFVDSAKTDVAEKAIW